MRRLDILVVLPCLLAMVGLGAGMVVSAPPDRIATPALAALETAPEPDEFREGIVGPVRTLDPQFATTPAERAVTGLLFRGLTRAGSDGTVLPDLAERWDVGEDGSVVTFHLRPDARWHDGVHVSADDVVFSHESSTEMEVRRIDRFTVELRTQSTLSDLLVLARQPITPAHLLADVAPSERAAHPFGQSPVGNGPFALLEMSDEAVLLERVGAPPGGSPPAYDAGSSAPIPEPTPRSAPRARAQLDRYRFLLFPDQEALVTAFASGELDAMAGPLPDDLLRLAADPDVKALAFAGTRSLVLVPNLRFGAGPLRDAQVRRALSSAIDRDRIVQSVFAGSGLTAVSIVSPASLLLDSASVPEPAVDVVAARSGLAAAGWMDGPGGWLRPGSSEPVSIELLVRDEASAPLDAAVAEMVAQDWRSLGLDVHVVSLPPDELVSDRLRPGSFDVALLEIDLGLDPDPSPLFQSSQAVVGGSNVAGYQSSLVDRLLAGFGEADADERSGRFAALQAALLR
ncbi:MAG: ABC transporter substrate-binding protein, partial [Chloroflexota bacterium]|nr:ABC transporter substrate-binding protein [Chloroflexota bacterium]